MGVNSLSFMVFVITIIAIYFLMPKKARWVILLIGSYIFYWINSNFLIVFLLITTISIYIVSILMSNIDKNLKEKIKTLEKQEKKKLKEKSKKKKKILVIISIIINVGILAVLKYSNFFTGNLVSLLSLININIEIPKMTFALPLGISYYTLQALSYVIDVYRGKISADKNLGKVALFLSFFPQITEGPIGRYGQLANQLYEPHEFDFKRVKHGFELIIWGFFQKMVIADRVGIFVDGVFTQGSNNGGFIIILGILFYTLQIYTDFSGYMCIVKGIAEVFGISLEENFKRPFFSRSVQEFWRRWNITLGVWLKEYVFYSVAFSKWCMKFTGFLNKNFKKHKHLVKVLPSLVALFFVWFLNGLWHGASWKYVFYGMYYFAIMTIGILLEPIVNKILNKLRINPERKGYKMWQLVRTFIIVNIGMLIFRTANVTETFTILKSIINLQGNNNILSFGLEIGDFIVLIISIIILLIVECLQERNHKIREELDNKNIIVRWGSIYVGIFSIIIFGIYGKEYNPSSFIYGQF